MKYWSLESKVILFGLVFIVLFLFMRNCNQRANMRALIKSTEQQNQEEAKKIREQELAIRALTVQRKKYLEESGKKHKESQETITKLEKENTKIQEENERFKEKVKNLEPDFLVKDTREIIGTEDIERRADEVVFSLEAFRDTYIKLCDWRVWKDETIPNYKKQIDLYKSDIEQYELDIEKLKDSYKAQIASLYEEIEAKDIIIKNLKLGLKLKNREQLVKTMTTLVEGAVIGVIAGVLVVK